MNDNHNIFLINVVISMVLVFSAIIFFICDLSVYVSNFGFSGIYIIDFGEFIAIFAFLLSIPFIYMSISFICKRQ